MYGSCILNSWHMHAVMVRSITSICLVSYSNIHTTARDSLIMISHAAMLQISLSSKGTPCAIRKCIYQRNQYILYFTIRFKRCLDIGYRNMVCLAEMLYVIISLGGMNKPNVIYVYICLMYETHQCIATQTFITSISGFIHLRACPIILEAPINVTNYPFVNT